MSDTVTEATRDTFHDLVAEGTVLVDVWGPDCQPCLALNPHVEKLAEDHAGELKVVKLEAPKARRLCMSMGLMGLPIFLLYKDGEEVDRISGPAANTPKQVTAFVDKNLKGGS
ncbi:MAG: thioredoxin 1 [Actinomycetota bacterium]|jgi:thioredoxin 1|nr:thioredoxin 1 [Actinomycetota bacterium]MEA2933112.1 thioredoxin 1 [Actinomycetota bacterium]